MIIDDNNGQAHLTPDVGVITATSPPYRNFHSTCIQRSQAVTCLLWQQGQDMFSLLKPLAAAERLDTAQLLLGDAEFVAHALLLAVFHGVPLGAGHGWPS